MRIGIRLSTAITRTLAAAPATGSRCPATTGTIVSTTRASPTKIASCWPDSTAHPAVGAAGIPTPYPSQRLLGGAICSWSNPQAVEDMIFFGDCFKDKMPSGFAGPGWPRPAPRAPIVAERLWAGAIATSQDVLERVGCNYWEIPPPSPPSPPPTPGGQFSSMPGACRDVSGGIPHRR